LSIEHEMKESIEDGVEDGIIKAVEKLIQKGLIDEITQNIINIVGVNLLKVIGSTILIEQILKVVFISEAQKFHLVILKIIECKFGAIADAEFINEVKKISSFDKIDVVIKSILECDSLEAIKTYVKSINSMKV